MTTGTSIKRVFKAGFLGFWRNRVVSLTAVVVMSTTLFAIGSLLFSNALVSQSVTELENKVDIDVYFVTTAPETDITDLKTSLEALPEVATVTYTSRDEVLENFRERHANDQLTLQALDELGENPFGATLSIKAKDTSHYEGIAKYLDQEQTALQSGGSPIIDKINYYQNKDAIDKLSSIIAASERSSLAKTIALVLISILITFNTIRLAIFNAREEIAVMKLVGASNWYARGPFIVEGAIYGTVAAIIALLLFYPMTLWLGPLFYPFSFFSDFSTTNLMGYYLSNFLTISLVVLGSGIFLGVVSSFLAAARYLKV
jgi:cell division transport system permease protein